MKIILLSGIWKGSIIAILLLLIIPLSVSYAQQNDWNTGKLVISFTNIKSIRGTIKVGLYDDASQWTDNPAYSFIATKKDLTGDRLTVTFDSLSRKTYAIAVLDDINDNNKMDFRLGLPIDGFGMSTNPSFFKLKPPSYDEVKFELDAAALQLEIKMNYIIVGKD